MPRTSSRPVVRSIPHVLVSRAFLCIRRPCDMLRRLKPKQWQPRDMSRSSCTCVGGPRVVASNRIESWTLKGSWRTRRKSWRTSLTVSDFCPALEGPADSRVAETLEYVVRSEPTFAGGARRAEGRERHSEGEAEPWLRWRLATASAKRWGLC